MLPLRISEFSIRELLDGVARRFASRAEAAGRHLKVAATASGTMRGDRLRHSRCGCPRPRRHRPGDQR
jgi:hypothetical protein